MAADLVHALAALEADFSVRVLVLTGAGKQFCAGADLVEFKRYLETDHARTQEPYNARVLFPVTQRLASCRLPVIAAINGGATAGGLDLALACDMRIASTAAKMGETYIKLGLNPGNGGTYFMPRLIGSGMAAELALTGDIIDADRALEIGLVNRVVAPRRPDRQRGRTGSADCRASAPGDRGDQEPVAPVLAHGPHWLDEHELLGCRGDDPHGGLARRGQRGAGKSARPATTRPTADVGRGGAAPDA
ncbi:enoyl-CoA hydratase/isomerase family protein [Novosphingobium colocasiae]